MSSTWSKVMLTNRLGITDGEPHDARADGASGHNCKDARCQCQHVANELQANRQPPASSVINSFATDNILKYRMRFSIMKIKVAQ